MATLLCRRYPAYRILDPVTLAVVVPVGASARTTSFVGGRLDIEPDDPNYALVMAEAARNPEIIVLASVLDCPDCGEPFTGSTARAQLGSHRKHVHFDRWIADQDARQAAERNVIVKSRDGIPCDVCPNQSFATAEELALHVRIVHAATPTENREGFENTIDPDGAASGGGGAASVATIPPATPTA